MTKERKEPKERNSPPHFQELKTLVEKYNYYQTKANKTKQKQILNTIYNIERELLNGVLSCGQY